MFKSSSIIKSWSVAVLCVVCFYGTSANAETVKLVNPAGDEATLNYLIDVEDGMVVINFGYIDDLRLGESNRSKYYKIKDDRLKVIFLDGKNIDTKVEKVEVENGIILDCITTPGSWEYKKSSKEDHIFCLNDMRVQPKIMLAGNQNQRLLKIPLYVAYTKTDGPRKFLVVGGKRYKTTYHIISAFDPVEIELPVSMKAQGKPANSSATSREIRVFVDSTIIDPEPEPIPQDNLGPGGQGDLGGLNGDNDNNAEKMAEYDAIVNKKLSQLKIRLDSCKCTEQIDAIDNEYQGLKQSYESDVSPTVKEKLTDFATTISNKRKEIKPGEEKWKWIKRIIAGLCALLGALGFHKLQNIRNAKNLKGLEEMQQKMVRRAENEAKRRAQSTVRNKTHQMIGKAKQKGRQAARSGVTELGDRIKGEKTQSSGAPANGNTPSRENGGTRPPMGRFANKHSQSAARRPKPGKNGEISI